MDRIEKYGGNANTQYWDDLFDPRKYRKKNNFHWDENSEKAAVLVAQGSLSNKDIADECGVSPIALKMWKMEPQFQGRIVEYLEGYRRHVFNIGIADKTRRIDALNSRWMKLRQIIEDRSKFAREEWANYEIQLQDYYEAQNDDNISPKPLRPAAPQRPPGFETGLLIENSRGYRIDTALLHELRECEMQASKEMGQWTEKQEISGPNGGPVEIDVAIEFEKLRKLPADELIRLHSEAIELT